MDAWLKGIYRNPNRKLIKWVITHKIWWMVLNLQSHDHSDDGPIFSNNMKISWEFNINLTLSTFSLFPVKSKLKRFFNFLIFKIFTPAKVSNVINCFLEFNLFLKSKIILSGYFAKRLLLAFPQFCKVKLWPFQKVVHNLFLFTFCIANHC